MRILSLSLILIMICSFFLNNVILTSYSTLNWSGPVRMRTNTDENHLYLYHAIHNDSRYYCLGYDNYLNVALFGKSTDLKNWDFTKTKEIVGVTSNYFQQDFIILDNGSILLIYRIGQNETVYTISDDNGEIWSEPLMINNTDIGRTLLYSFEYQNEIYLLTNSIDSSNTLKIWYFNLYNGEITNIDTIETSCMNFKGIAILNDQMYFFNSDYDIACYSFISQELTLNVLESDLVNHDYIFTYNQQL